MSKVQRNADPLRWCVVGGGFMGLTAALRLAQAGQRVTLLEAAPQIGGLAGAWDLGPVTWDKFYHVTLLSDLRTRAVLQELNLSDQVEWRQTKTGFYSDGRLHSMSNSWEFLTFPPLSLVGKMRLAATILAASKKTDLRALEQTPVEEWLRKWSGDATTDKVWLPLLRAKLGSAYQKTSAAFIVATIHRMYAARRSGMKREMFGYVRGGYASVLAALARRLTELGVDVRTGQRISSVRRAGQEGLIVNAVEGATAYDQVVLTTPSPVAASLCPQMADLERENHTSREYLGVVCPSVLLKRPLADYYVTNITDAGLPFTAVIEMTALVDPMELEGRRLVYLPRYALPTDPIWGRSDDAIREEFLCGLQKMYPGFDPSDVQAVRVARARSVLPVPELGYSDTLPPIRTSVPGVSVLNSVQIVGGTLNVNETIQVAEHAVQSELLPHATASLSTRQQEVIAT